MRPYPTPRSCTFAPQDLRVSVDLLAGTIRVGGELDRASVHHVTDALNALRSSPSPVWTLDLQGLSFCDVEGLRALHGAVTLAHSTGRSLHLTRVPGLVVDLLALISREFASDGMAMPLRLREVAVAT